MTGLIRTKDNYGYISTAIEHGLFLRLPVDLYGKREPVETSAKSARHDAQQALDRPVATIPRCPRCGKQRVLFQGTCGTCGDAEREEDEARRG